METRDLEAKVGELSAKIDSVVLGYKIGVLSLLVLFSIINLGNALSISVFQQFYQDALPRKPLPLPTLDIFHFQTLLVCLVFIWPLLGAVAAFTIKQFPVLAFILAALLSLVAVQIVLTWFGLILPMINPVISAADPN